MALTFRTFTRHYLPLFRKPAKCNIVKLHNDVKFLSNNKMCLFSIEKNIFVTPTINFTRHIATPPPQADPPVPEKPSEEKVGLFQKFKAMYRDYWYVLVPVHLVTSAVWIGGFYYTVVSGVDIIGILQSVGVSERVIAPMRDSKAGYFALTYALYKIATPVRYAVTLGGTTFAIQRLTDMGWIKPVPSKERIKEMIAERRDNLMESKQHYQCQMKMKSSQVIEEMNNYKSSFRNLKSKVKKM